MKFYSKSVPSSSFEPFARSISTNWMLSFGSLSISESAFSITGCGSEDFVSFFSASFSVIVPWAIQSAYGKVVFKYDLGMEPARFISVMFSRRPLTTSEVVL